MAPFINRGKAPRDGRWLARREPGRRRFGPELAQPAHPEARLLVGTSGGRREAEFETVIGDSDRSKKAGRAAVALVLRPNSPVEIIKVWVEQAPRRRRHRRLPAS